MNITLYKYSNRSLIANKMEDRELITLFSGNITPYGEFNSQKVSFRLSDLYEANYCKYEFNGKEYYGYVNVDVDSKGLYVYNVVVDALSTCWYNGCFDVPAFIERSSEQTNVNRDTLAGWTDKYDKETVSISRDRSQSYGNSDYHILIQTIWSGFDWVEQSFAPLGQQLTSEEYGKFTDGNFYYLGEKENETDPNITTYLYPIGVMTYVLTLQQWKVFQKNFFSIKDESLQKSIGTSIIKIGMVDGETLGFGAKDWVEPELDDFGYVSGLINRGQSSTSSSPILAEFEAGMCNKHETISWQPAIIFSIKDGKSKGVPISDTTYNQNSSSLGNMDFAFYFKHTTTELKVEPIRQDVYLESLVLLSPLEDYNFQFFYTHSTSPIMVKIRDISDRCFIDYAWGLSIETIGCETYFDPASWITTYYPRFNGITEKAYISQGELSTQFPIAIDTSITNWTSVITGVLATIGTTIATLVAAPTLAASVSTISGAVGSLGGQAASLINQEINGGYAVKGVSGGNINYLTGERNRLIIYRSCSLLYSSPYYGGTDYTAQIMNMFAGQFGLLNNIMVPSVQNWININGDNEELESKYFVKTSQIKLSQNGLPQQIIQEAERISNSGFNITYPPIEY